MVLKIKEIPIFSHEKLLSKIVINKENNCWEWGGTINTGGYGIFNIKEKGYRTHRLTYSLFIGNADVNLLIDHICRNRSCCNPEHLRLVTHKENVTENSESVASINKNRINCKNGHEFNDKRRCKTCLKERSAKRRLKLKDTLKYREQFKKSSKEYYYKNRDKILTKMAKKYKEKKGEYIDGL